MNPSSDDDLHRLFDEARRADEANAPAFHDVLRRATVARSARNRRAWGGLAAAAAAAAAIAFVAVVSEKDLRHRPDAAVRIETWKAPTDFLLESSFPTPLDEIPTLPDPVPDYSRLLQKEKGSTS